MAHMTLCYNKEFMSPKFRKSGGASIGESASDRDVTVYALLHI